MSPDFQDNNNNTTNNNNNINNNNNNKNNKNSKKDIKYTINLCRILALILGLWPINYYESIWKKIIKFFLNFSACFLMICAILSNILSAIFEMNELHEKVEITGPTNFYIMSLSKYLLILLRGESVKKCFKYIENDWKLKKIELHRQVMLKNARYGRYLIIICAIFMYFGGFGYHLVRPLLSEKIITEMNQTVYPYPAPIYGKILNTGQSPYYELIFITLLIADFVLFSATVVSFSFASVLTLHACGQLEIITLYLNDLVNDDLEETKNSPHKRLIIIVNSHLTILRFVNQLESLLNEICLIEVVGCSVNMCLVGYYVIESWKREELIACFSYAIILTSFTFNIFIYCYLGELLTNQATKLAEKAYMIDWHRLPKTTSLDLLFFIRVCQFPAKISAGKIVILSMSTFSTVIRSSAAYFNALWKMSQ